MWKIIKYKDIKDLYEVNQSSVIRNRFTKKVIKPHIGGHGYLQVKLARTDHVAPITVHGIVAHTFIKYNKSIIDPEVNHKNGKLDNSLDNLEIISRVDNFTHAKENGLLQSLENRYNASLTNKEVHHICKMLENGVCYKDIRKTMGSRLSSDVLKKIRSGDNYREISKLYNLSNSVSHKYTESLRRDIRNMVRLGTTNVNEILTELKIEKNASSIDLVKKQRSKVKKGSTTIERNYIEVGDITIEM